ncbi:MFS transporter [Nocardioides sp. W3-2-3]|nr:MFS transporter [Nocardioides convexus]
MRVASVVALGGLLAVLDTTIVAVALPRFMSAFDVPLGSAQWIVTAYALGMVAALPLAPAAAARWGPRRSYVGALVLFALASVAAGVTGSLGGLIAARAVQGIAGGLVNPIGMAIGFGTTAPERRARVTAVTGLPLLLGPIAGPLAGGLLLDAGSWRALFFVTVPPALLAVAGALRWIPADPPAGHRPPLDVLGALLLTPGVVGATLGIGGHELAAVARAALATAGMVLVAAFVRRSWSRPEPLLRVRLLADPVFARNAAVLVCYAAPYFGAMILLPTYVQVLRGDSPLVSAGLMVPSALGMGLTIQVAARLLERHGARRVVGTGLAVAIAQGVVLATVLRLDTPYPVVAALALLQGAGTGAVMLPTIASAGRDLHGADLASGSALLPILSTIATAIGTASVGALWAGLGAHTDPMSAYRITVGATVVVMALALAVRLARPAPARILVEQAR